MNKLATIFIILICSAVCQSQILKIDKGNIHSDSSGYFMGAVNLNFNINNRSATAEKDIKFVGLEANADVAYIADKHAYILINKINYFKSTGGPLLSTGYAHFRTNFLRRKKLSYESFTQIQYDDGRNMPFRFLLGAGIKYRLASTEKAQLFIGIGGMFEKENWKSIEDEHKIIKKEIWKTTNYINGKIRFNEHVSFNTVFYYQGGYDEESELFRSRISGDVVLQMELSQRLSFTTTFTAQYEDKPIISINNFVYSLTNGLKWSF
ncbi:hypothetical protein C900_01253 [Fulvivirga imtechensis AK7]|uniref:DUF481 domain-containing protein n=1 Tax=Fulvivirga imtechensis AK7 TaxID=1237149 RepID=L8JIE6_9BACT|nr:DUF481 domain-containing protein [Fulvivirga imtechensis]ELR68028.1 hypothetical protein C900_01253 [Fulvivirga imtechensis AK7]